MANMHDPMRDPMDPLDPRPVGYRDIESPRKGRSWGWIAGGLLALLLLFVFVFGFGRDGDRTASTTPPAATTGQTTGSAPATAPRPAGENTGIAPRDTTTR